MRFHFGDLTWDQAAPSKDAGYNRIHSPSSRLGYGLAIGIGLLVILLLFGWLVGVSIFTDRSGIVDNSGGGPVPWAAVLLALLLIIPVHELFHALFLPHMGLTPQTIIFIWPKKFHFGVYYDGCLSRGRWLVMRLAPFVCLTALTIGLLTLFYFIPAPYGLVVFLQVFFLINGIGSGGDIVAVIWVLRQAPAKCQVCFIGGKAYWRLDG